MSCLRVPVFLGKLANHGVLGGKKLVWLLKDIIELLCRDDLSNLGYATLTFYSTVLFHSWEEIRNLHCFCAIKALFPNTCQKMSLSKR